MPTSKPVIAIRRRNHFNGHGALQAFSWLYSLAGCPNGATYEGTPLRSIRRIAKRIAGEIGATVKQDW